MKDTSDILIPEYFSIHSTALLRLQFVEESLRMYMSRCCELIRLKTKGEILYKYTYADLKKRTLGVLVEDFKRTNGNILLGRNITALVKDRNHCAHSALLMTFEEVHDAEYVKNEIKKIAAIAEMAQSCFVGLMEEIKNIDKILAQYQ